MTEVVQKSVVVLCLIQHISAQLSSVEERRNVTGCNIDSFTIDCGSSVIAVESIIFKYDVSCETTCCGYDSAHCSDNPVASERNSVRRECSGKSSCIIDLSGVRDFCSVGVHEPSYVTIYYYCIPSDRQVSICSSTTLQSSGLPLYLTNNNYPGVTTGDSTCSCSLEVYDCSSSVYLYVIDADLYSDTSSCEQSLEFRDSSNAILQEIKCENYYGFDITTQTLNKHYITINFLDNSIENLEGLFFLGFSASTESSQFNLSCSTKSESRCVDCDSSFDIGNGTASLAVENDSSYGASANVVCDDGFATTKETILCTDTGSWETSECTKEADVGDSKEDDNERTDTSKDGGGGLKTWMIDVIVAVPVTLLAVTAIYCIKRHCFQ